MTRFKLAVSLFVSALLFSSSTFAHSSFKGEVTPITVAPHSWTGFYAGLNAGAVNYTMNITDNQATSFNATIQQRSNPKFTGGFQVGYRYQVNITKASGVYGAEFSTNFSNTTFNKTYGSPFALYQFASQDELKNLCLLQFIGGIAVDRTLLFLAAGLSWANITGNITSQSGTPFFKSLKIDNKGLGTTLGGGIEYAFNEKISTRLKIDVITPTTYTSHNNTGASFQVSNNIVQGTLGVNYKFF